MKKTVVLVFVLFVCVAGPQTIKAYIQTCTLRGAAVWKYNDYVGLKPDVGATVFAFQRFTPKTDITILDLALERSVEEHGLFLAKADSLGKFEFPPLPAGIYDVIVQSYSTKRN